MLQRLLLQMISNLLFISTFNLSQVVLPRGVGLRQHVQPELHSKIRIRKQTTTTVHTLNM